MFKDVPPDLEDNVDPVAVVVDNLAMLARVYHTTGRALLTDNELATYDNLTQTAINTINHRHLDPNQTTPTTDDYLDTICDTKPTVSAAMARFR